VAAVYDMKGNLTHCFKEGKEWKREKAVAGNWIADDIKEKTPIIYYSPALPFIWCRKILQNSACLRQNSIQ
jgi:hypothetical protein